VWPPTLDPGVAALTRGAAKLSCGGGGKVAAAAFENDRMRWNWP
jgi:hypothetical protein